MTNIIFKKNQFLYSITCKGHTGKAFSGEDVLCSAISALVQSTYLGISKVLGLDVKFKKEEKKGEFSFELSKQQAKIANVLMQTLYISLKDIEIGNEKFMKVEVCNEIY